MVHDVLSFSNYARGLTPGDPDRYHMGSIGVKKTSPSSAYPEISSFIEKMAGFLQTRFGVPSRG
jgi:hypothetical protein